MMQIFTSGTFWELICSPGLNLPQLQKIWVFLTTLNGNNKIIIVFKYVDQILLLNKYFFAKKQDLIIIFS